MRVISLMRGNAAKHWCFTLNNPGLLGEQALGDRLRVLLSEGTAVYAIYGRETGASGTPHLQGYVSLASKQRLSWLKANLSEGAHFEVRRGTQAQAIDYCKKDGDFQEFGTVPVSKQGQRTDLEKAKALIDDGHTIVDVAEECFAVFAKYERALRSYALMKATKRNWVTEVFVYWGTTGTGKTRRVHDQEEDLWVACDNQLRWFDGYEGQEAVLFDDFVSIKNEKFGFLLQLLDRYEMRVPVKGGFVNWSPKRVYFTSNLRFDEWFTGVSPSSFDALKRRITRCIHFNIGLLGLHGHRESDIEEA